jgi:hypothetical protein
MATGLSGCPFFASPVACFESLTIVLAATMPPLPPSPFGFDAIS